jgi:hypothetical protein
MYAQKTTTLPILYDFLKLASWFRHLVCPDGGHLVSVKCKCYKETHRSFIRYPQGGRCLDVNADKSKRMLFTLRHQNAGEIRNIKGEKCGKFQIFEKDSSKSK